MSTSLIAQEVKGIIPAGSKDPKTLPVVVAVPKELAPGEQRVATVPEVVQKLTKSGYEIRIEHKFTMQCRLYGYEHHLIAPAYPRANSHVERTHRIDKEEVYKGKIFSSLQELNKLNLSSLKYFNEKRPQKSKHFMTPLKFAI